MATQDHSRPSGAAASNDPSYHGDCQDRIGGAGDQQAGVVAPVAGAPATDHDDVTPGGDGPVAPGDGGAPRIS